jgi:hypothetical protein
MCVIMNCALNSNCVSFAVYQTLTLYTNLNGNLIRHIAMETVIGVRETCTCNTVLNTAKHNLLLLLEAVSEDHLQP